MLIFRLDVTIIWALTCAAATSPSPNPEQAPQAVMVGGASAGVSALPPTRAVSQRFTAMVAM